MTEMSAQAGNVDYETMMKAKEEPKQIECPPVEKDMPTVVTEVQPEDMGDSNLRRSARAKAPLHHHPTYNTMIREAILCCNEKGTSKAAVLKYLAQHYELGENIGKINSHLRMALKKGLEDGEFIQVHGHGASGSFRVGAAHNMMKGAMGTPTKKTIMKKGRKGPAKKEVTEKKAVAEKKEEAPVEKEEKAKPIKKVGKKPKTLKRRSGSKKRVGMGKKKAAPSKLAAKPTKLDKKPKQPAKKAPRAKVTKKMVAKKA